MSRIYLNPKDLSHEVVAGFDPPLKTYFISVSKNLGDSDEEHKWLEFRDKCRPAEVIERIKKYAADDHLSRQVCDAIDAGLDPKIVSDLLLAQGTEARVRIEWHPNSKNVIYATQKLWGKVEGVPQYNESGHWWLAPGPGTSLAWVIGKPRPAPPTEPGKDSRPGMPGVICVEILKE